MDSAGNLYGTTEGGGPSPNCNGGCGTVFELVFDSATNSFSERVLYFFQGGSDGYFPVGGLVRDSAGNLYGTTTDGGPSGNAGIVFELVFDATTNSYTENVLHAFSFAIGEGNTPEDTLVRDSAGNLYGTTHTGGSSTGDGTVFELMFDSGNNSYTEKVLYSFTGGAADGNNPYSNLARDPVTGNLFGTTEGGGTYGGGTAFELEYDPGTSAYTEKVLHSFMDGANDGILPEGGLLIDSSGNLFGTTEHGGINNYGTVFKLTPSGGETVLYSFSSSDGASPAADLIADASGNLYGTTGIGGTYNGGTVFEITGSGFVPPRGNNSIGPIDFGTIAVGSSSAVVSLTFTIKSTGTIFTPAVLTQGTPNLDFTDAGTGTCDTNGTSFVYSAGDTCTVDLFFKPQSPGPRYGAVELLDNTGSLIATAFLKGTGLGPQVNFLPGSFKVIASQGPGNYFPWAVAVDANGNVFVPNINNNAVTEFLGSTGYSTTRILGGGFSAPEGIAIDGAGNLFVADSGNGVVKEILAAGGYTTTRTLSVGFSFPMGLAIDGGGNLFVADFNYVYEVMETGGYTQVKTIGSGFGWAQGLAVDGNGNLFVTDGIDHQVSELLASGDYTTVQVLGSGFSNPIGVTVDVNDNVLVTDAGNATLNEIVAAGGYKTVLTLVSNLNAPFGLARDGRGNLSFADASGTPVKEIDYADPPQLNFPTATPVGTIDGTDGELSATVENVGNSSLTFSIPNTGNNPSIGSDFTLDSSSPGTCPLTDSSSSTPSTLSAGSMCTLPVTFAPQTAGNLNESVNLTDNNLNAVSATQSILLSGTATSPAFLAQYIQSVMISQVQALGLNNGQENSLLKELNQAINLLYKGKINGAITNLEDFIAELNDLASSGKLSPQKLSVLVGEANKLILELQAFQ